VVGIPGRIIQTKGTQIQNPSGMDLNHHLIPDPVGKAIACLVERLDELEAKQSASLAVGTDENCDSCEAETLCASKQTSTVAISL
jgi:serine O-acetyltransferase